MDRPSAAERFRPFAGVAILLVAVAIVVELAVDGPYMLASRGEHGTCMHYAHRCGDECEVLFYYPGCANQHTEIAGLHFKEFGDGTLDCYSWSFANCGRKVALNKDYTPPRLIALGYTFLTICALYFVVYGHCGSFTRRPREPEPDDGDNGGDESESSSDEDENTDAEVLQLEDLPSRPPAYASEKDELEAFLESK